MFENLNEIIFSIFLFLIVLFFYLHIQFQFKTSNEHEIYEIEQELSKEKLEEICDLRQPIILDTTEELSQLIPLFSKNNIVNEFSSYEIKIRNKQNIGTNDDMFIPIQLLIVDKLFSKDASHNYYSENNHDFLYESGLLKNIKSNDFIIKPQMSCNSLYDFMFGPENAETKLKYDVNYRNYIMPTDGQISVRLIPPKYEKYLNLEIDYEFFEHRSNVNVWNPQEKYMKKIKYLDVSLPVGKLLYIPPYWMYSIKFHQTSTLLFMKYQTYMNICAISPKLIMRLLQSHNIKSTYLKKVELKNIIEPSVQQLENTEQESSPPLTFDDIKIDEIKIEETKIDEIIITDDSSNK